MKVALYARVSTEGQDPEVQLMALRAHATLRGWLVVDEFVDRGISGAKERRPALDRLMKTAWAGQFQVVLVWRFDRFARSVKHLVAALETFRSLHVEFVSLQEQASTPPPPSARPCSPSSAPWPSSNATSSASGSRPALSAPKPGRFAWGARGSRWPPMQLVARRDQGLSVGEIGPATSL